MTKYCIKIKEDNLHEIANFVGLKPDKDLIGKYYFHPKSTVGRIINGYHEITIEQFRELTNKLK